MLNQDRDKSFETKKLEKRLSSKTCFTWFDIYGSKLLSMNKYPGYSSIREYFINILALAKNGKFSVGVSSKSSVQVCNLQV